MGEHAVLHGHRAIVGAVDERVEVLIRPRPDNVVSLNSTLGNWHGTLENIDQSYPFTFVAAAFDNLPVRPDKGFELTINSRLATDMGLGTSAAVTVATIAAARCWTTGVPAEPEMLIDAAVKTIRRVQGAASGADVAAAVYGGVLLYRAEPLEIMPVCKELPLTLLYSGFKTPTAEVIRYVQDRASRFPDGFAGIYELMDATVGEGFLALQRNDLRHLGFLWDFHQGLQDAIGVNNEDLQRLVELLRRCNGIMGAKISGSGLGDAVIGLGHTTDSLPQDKIIAVRLCGEGVSCEAG